MKCKTFDFFLLTLLNLNFFFYLVFLSFILVICVYVVALRQIVYVTSTQSSSLLPRPFSPFIVFVKSDVYQELFLISNVQYGIEEKRWMNTLLHREETGSFFWGDQCLSSLGYLLLSFYTYCQ